MSFSFIQVLQLIMLLLVVIPLSIYFSVKLATLGFLRTRHLFESRYLKKETLHHGKESKEEEKEEADNSV